MSLSIARTTLAARVPLRAAVSLRTVSLRAYTTASPRFTAPARPRPAFTNLKMTSSFSTDVPEVKAGDALPSVAIKTSDGQEVDFSKLDGKNIIVTVPGAFTPTCHSQVPGFVFDYATITGEKGIKDVYIVSVNDLFVMKAWKKDILASAGIEETSAPKFVADIQANLASALGLVLDARAGLGNYRLKRAVVVVQDGKVVSAAVEPDSGKSTVTQSDAVVKSL